MTIHDGLKLQVPYFLSPESFLSVPLKAASDKTLQVTLEFRPQSPDGVLLSTRGEQLTLLLSRGFVVFRTISRRLVANGLHSCRPLRRLPLTPPNRRQRLEWCRARSTWMTEWHRVVFSDESRFCLSSDSRRVRVWRRRGKRSNPAAIVERPTVRQGGIMVWGAIAYDSRSPLLRIQGTMTAQRYVDDVLRPVTLPYLQGVPNALYQQDNARPHTARISQQALQDVQMLPWPPYSPDLSPIEHIWDIIGRRLHALPQPRSEDELWQMDVWMQVNSGKQVHHRLPMVLYKVRLGPDLRLGAPRSNFSVAPQGFTGCVRYLEINGRVHNFSKREVLSGLGIALTMSRCDRGVSPGRLRQDLLSERRHVCQPQGPLLLCLSAPGYRGLLLSWHLLSGRCGVPVKKLVVPAFNGRSFLQFAPLEWSALSLLELALVFRPTRPDGLLLFSGNRSAGGDFVQLALSGGFVEFSYNLGSGVGMARHVSGPALTSLYSHCCLGPLYFCKRCLQCEMTPDVLCLQLEVNGRPVALAEDAVAAENVSGCRHPCEEGPCYNGGRCLPNLDFYTCRCGLGHAGPNCEKGKSQPGLLHLSLWTGPRRSQL
ncbi:EGFLAM [Cordylochernes scorpioides]|uniref:EGFLAM n=1 Tax=Cordylochernes scorpioides TaxID=51811 RepID=A0ABY6KF76_9ARAC|nr:EGFLAM [Cordylochernes scorpioides]